jgi:hypothetical protein
VKDALNKKWPKSTFADSTLQDPVQELFYYNLKRAKMNDEMALIVVQLDRASTTFRDNYKNILSGQDRLNAITKAYKWTDEYFTDLDKYKEEVEAYNAKYAEWQKKGTGRFNNYVENTRNIINQGLTNEEYAQEMADAKQADIKEGSGFGRRNMIHSKHIKPRLSEHHYKLYQDKYYIDLKKLDLGILEIRYTNNKHLTIKPMMISEKLCRVIIDLMHQKDITSKAIQDLTTKEQHLLKTVSFYFGKNIDHITEKANDLAEKWQIIKGEIMSGNDNVVLKRQARDMLLYFVDIGKMTRHDFTRYVNDLNL